MARVKGGPITKRRRKKIIKKAKGYFGTKSTNYKKAKEQIMKSWIYSYRDRKQCKRNFRLLWIQRINAAVRMYNITYSNFINNLNKKNIKINRKILSELAINNPDEFKILIKKIK